MNKDLRKELLQLPPAERIDIAMELWESVTTDDLPPLTAEQIAEVEQEWAEHQKDPSSAVPWEDVRVWLRSKLR